MFKDQEADLPAPWQWPGLWSLNLPVLVVVWQLLFAKSFHVWLGAYHLFTAAALAWAFVVTERWIFLFRLRADLAQKLLPPRELGEQRGMIVRICLLIVVGLVLLGILRTTTRELAGILIWSSAGGAYLAGVRWAPARTAELLPQEISAAVFLAGTVALFIWANGMFSPVHLLLPTLLFVLLLFYYFCLVSLWSKPLLPDNETEPLLKGSLALFYRAPLLLIFAAAGMVFVSPSAGSEMAVLTIAVSALILLLLDLWQGSLSPRATRLFADVALLAPVVPLAVTAM